MSEALKLAKIHTEKWLAGLETNSVSATATEAQLRAAFDTPLPETGSPAAEVVDFIAENASDGLLGSPSGRFFAWVIGGTLPSALAADWMVSAWDQNAALYGCSPASSIIEEVAGTWEASFAFTTGCQMAHMTALAAARHATLAAHGWSVEEDGLFGAPRVKIFTSGNRHGSVERAVRYLGFGTKSFWPVDTDNLGRMQPQALAAAIKNHSGPKIVALNAADLNVGAFDPFAALIPIAKQAGAWVHIDGAFGLFARTSKKKRYLTEGIEQADSWVTDGHKWLNTPFDCGISIIRNPDAHRRAMTLSASYVASTKTARDQIDWNPEWSRRARSVPVYAAIKELGKEGVEDMIDRCCAHCLKLVEGLGALEGGQIIASPILNQGLVRFSKPSASDQENDQFTLEVMEAINSTGEAFFSDSMWNGQRVIRVSVVNWQTSDNDIARALHAAAKVLANI